MPIGRYFIFSPIVKWDKKSYIYGPKKTTRKNNGKEEEKYTKKTQEKQHKGKKSEKYFCFQFFFFELCLIVFTSMRKNRPNLVPRQTPPTSQHYNIEGFKGALDQCGISPTQRKLFEILLNQTKIRLY